MPESHKKGKGNEQQDEYEPYDEEESGQGQQIPDDGEYTSEHSSINLQEYLKNRENIPSDPEEESDSNSDQSEEPQDSSGAQKPISKKNTLDTKKKDKDINEDRQD